MLSNPFALAKVIYSLFITDTISVLVKRATLAITPTDNAITGMIDEPIGFIELYCVGKICNFDANNINIIIANTNEGTDTPITEITVAKVSQIVFLCNAANTPNNVPNTPPIMTALNPYMNEIFAAEPTSEATGISLYIL